MGVFCLSFRLHDDSGRSERQFALMRAVQAVKLRFWDRTDSFIVFETSHGLEFLAARLTAQVDPSKDLLLLLEIDNPAGVICGKNSDPDILKMLPRSRAI